MRGLNWVKRKWYDHKAWQAFKRQTLRTFMQPGFAEIHRNGVPVIRDTNSPASLPPDPLMQSVNDLIQVMGEEDTGRLTETSGVADFASNMQADSVRFASNMQNQINRDRANMQTKINERDAKMDIINRRIGA